MKKMLVFLLTAVCWVVADAQVAAPIRDAYGRTVILHGLNTAGGAKNSPGHQPWIQEKDVGREHRDLGWNAVRYLVFWGAIEPKKDSFDASYLAKVRERVKWYTDRGMYVIIDMHQDVYGYGVGDNGAPEWAATYTRIKNLIPDRWPWWMQNMEPKVIHSFVTFWKYKRRKELQDHYIRSWLKVVELLRDDPYVIGYDLMNEPHGGRLIKTLAGGFERRWLTAMYHRLIPAIRSEDTLRYIFFEPRSFGTNFGMRSHLPKVNDTIVHKMVYAPHCYMKFVDIGGDYRARDKKSLARWFRQRDREVQMQQSSFLLGEFGLSSQKKDFDKYTQDILSGMDQRQASWTYWSGDPGGWGPLNRDLTPSPMMWQLLRVFPAAVSGQLRSFHYDPATRFFDMDYISDDSIRAPTLISVPRLSMGDAYHWTVSGAEHYIASRDAADNSLQIIVSDPHAHVRVTIRP